MKALSSFLAILLLVLGAGCVKPMPSSGEAAEPTDGQDGESSLVAASPGPTPYTGDPLLEGKDCALRITYVAVPVTMMPALPDGWTYREQSGPGFTDVAVDDLDCKTATLTDEQGERVLDGHREFWLAANVAVPSSYGAGPFHFVHLLHVVDSPQAAAYYERLEPNVKLGTVATTRDMLGTLGVDVVEATAGDATYSVRSTFTFTGTSETDPYALLHWAIKDGKVAGLLRLHLGYSFYQGGGPVTFASTGPSVFGDLENTAGLGHIAVHSTYTVSLEAGATQA